MRGAWVVVRLQQQRDDNSGDEAASRYGTVVWVVCVGRDRLFSSRLVSSLLVRLLQWCRCVEGYVGWWVRMWMCGCQERVRVQVRARVRCACVRGLRACVGMCVWVRRWVRAGGRVGGCAGS
jgi:hypothetical protein